MRLVYRQLNVNTRLGRYNGRVSMHYDARFGWHVQKTPGPRRTQPSQAELASRANFALSTKYVRLLTPEQLASLQGFTAGSAWTWKDLAISLMYGRSVEIMSPDGVLLKGARDLNDQINSLLNSIGSRPGTVLVRYYDQWMGLEPGAVGEVITSNGEGTIPTYQPLPSGGSGGGGGTAVPVFGWAYPAPGLASTQNSGFAMKGSPIYLHTPITVDKISIDVNATNGATYSAFIAEITGSGNSMTISATVATAAARQVATFSGYQQFIFDLNPTVLDANKMYVLCGVCTSSSGGTNLPFGVSSQGNYTTLPLNQGNIIKVWSTNGTGSQIFAWTNNGDAPAGITSGGAQQGACFIGLHWKY